MVELLPPPDDIPVLDDDPFSEDTLREPLAFQARLREAGPLVWLSRYGCYAVGRYAEVAHVLSDWRTFSSARGVGILDFAKAEPWWREPAVLIESDPPRHNEIRARVARVLSARAIDSLRPDFEAQADALLDRVLQSGTIDAQREIAEAYPLKVFGDASASTRTGARCCWSMAIWSSTISGPRTPRCAPAPSAARRPVPSTG